MKKSVLCSCLAAALSTVPVYAQQITNVKGPGGYSITALDRQVSKPTVGGYFDTEFFINEDGSNTFKAHRLIMETSARLHDKILISTEIEYEYGAQINNLTDTGELKIEQAWVDFEMDPALVFRTGINVIPFGRVNTLHDSDVRDTTNKPIYNKYIVPGTWMDTSIGFHGVIDANEDMVVNYDAYIVNGLQHDGETLKVDGSNGIRKARPGFKKDNNRDKAFVGRVGVSPFMGLEVGGSYYTGDVDASGAKRLNIVGADAFLQQGPFEVLAEYAQISLDEIEGVPTAMNGYFAELRYHIMPDFLKNLLFSAGFERPVFTLFARYGAVDLDTSVEDKNDKTQTTIGVNYRPMETTVFKLEYEMNGEKKDETKNNAIIGSVAVGF